MRKSSLPGFLLAALLFFSAPAARAQASTDGEGEPADEEAEAAEEAETDEPQRRHGRPGFQTHGKTACGNIDGSAVDVDFENSGNVVFHIRCRKLEADGLAGLMAALEAGAKGGAVPPPLAEGSACAASEIQLETAGDAGSNRWLAVVRVDGAVRLALGGERPVDASLGAQFFEGRIADSAVSVRQASSHNRIVLIDCAGADFDFPALPAEAAAAAGKQIAAIAGLADFKPWAAPLPKPPSAETGKVSPSAPSDSGQGAFNLFINRTANWAGGVFGEGAYSDAATSPGAKVLGDWDGQLLDESLDRSVVDSSRVEIVMNHAANWQYLGAAAGANAPTAAPAHGIPELPPAGGILGGSLKNGGVFLSAWNGELVDETVDGALMNQASAHIHLLGTANWLMAFSAGELLCGSLHAGSSFLAGWNGELIDEAVDGAVTNGARSSVLLERTADWRLGLSGESLLNGSLLGGSSLIARWDGELLDESTDGEVRGNSTAACRMADSANWSASLSGKEILCGSLESAPGGPPSALLPHWNGELVDEVLDGPASQGANATVRLENSANFHFRIDGETVLEKSLAGNAAVVGHWEGELADEAIDGGLDSATASVEFEGSGNWFFEVQAKQAFESALASPAAGEPAQFLGRWDGELLDELLDGGCSNGSQARISLRNSANFGIQVRAGDAFDGSFHGNAAFLRAWEGELIDEIVDGGATDSMVEISMAQTANWNLSIEGENLFGSAFRGPSNHIVETWAGELLDETLDGGIASTRAPAQAGGRITKTQSANWCLDIRASGNGFEGAFAGASPRNAILGTWSGQLVDETLDGFVRGVPGLFLGSTDSGNWRLRLHLGQTAGLPPDFLRSHILGGWSGELVDELVDGEDASGAPAADAVLDSSLSVENVRSGNWILELESASRLELDAAFLAHPFGEKWTGALAGDTIHGSIRNSKVRIRESHCANFIIRAECATLALGFPVDFPPAGPSLPAP